MQTRISGTGLGVSEPNPCLVLLGRSSAKMAFLVLIERASGLRSADFMGKSDPYVNLVCGSAKYQTAIVDNNNNPVWDEMFLIHTQPGAEKLDFVLFDSDAGTIVDGSDDFLGQCSLDLRQCANNTNW